MNRPLDAAPVASPVRTDADGVRAQNVELRALLKRIRDHHGSYIDALPGPFGVSDLAAIDVALSKPEGETGPAVAVKPLEWDARYGYAARTETAFGWFTVLDLGEAVIGDPFKVDGPWALDEDRDSYFATLDAAKEAIQADYDRRIRAALTVSPSPSERDQHQGETRERNALREARKAILRIVDAKEPETLDIIRVIDAALSTPEAVPVADKREGGR